MSITNLFLIFLIFPVLWGCSISASVKITDSSNKPVIVGEYSWEEWQKKAEWEDYSASDYQPNQKKIEKLQNLLANKDVSFIIFATSYCDDCEKQVPIIFKILRRAKINTNKIKLFGLDKNLEEPSQTYKLYEVKAVPTVIILYNNNPIGKIEPPDYQWLDYFIEYAERIRQ